TGMLWYLDNAHNTLGRPNENFARELLELFTLGPGQFTQLDVTEAARAWTGHGLDGGTPGRYWFDGGNHDTGRKAFLGAVGNFDGPDIIDLIVDRRRQQHAGVDRCLLQQCPEVAHPVGAKEVVQLHRSCRIACLLHPIRQQASVEEGDLFNDRSFVDGATSEIEPVVEHAMDPQMALRPVVETRRMGGCRRSSAGVEHKVHQVGPRQPGIGSDLLMACPKARSAEEVTSIVFGPRHLCRFGMDRAELEPNQGRANPRPSHEDGGLQDGRLDRPAVATGELHLAGIKDVAPVASDGRNITISDVGLVRLVNATR
ncbi:MAG: DUF1800 family protein, partial [Actinomycetota bacterium]